MDMKRVGSFSVSDHIVNDNDKALLAARECMARVFITSALHNFGYGRFEYIGFSNDFEIVEAGGVAHRYNLLITYDENDNYTAHFEKLS